MKEPSCPPPDWAAELIQIVCSDFGRQPPKKVTWWHRDDWYSSGRTWPRERRIHVTAGTSDIDARFVLLHELGHYLAMPDWHHNRRFWELVWDLYQTYADGDLDWIIFREGQDAAKALTYCPLISS